jgi:hypothetical protein
MSSKYIQSEKVSITNGNNRGLTDEACANLRSDLFPCAVVQVIPKYID